MEYAVSFALKSELYWGLNLNFVFFKCYLNNDISVLFIKIINKKSGVDWNVMGLMIDDIRQELETIWRTTYANREGNSATHFLSKFASSNFMTIQWSFEPAQRILDIIRREQIALS
jgi:hypothetical protein